MLPLDMPTSDRPSRSAPSVRQTGNLQGVSDPHDLHNHELTNHKKSRSIHFAEDLISEHPARDKSRQTRFKARKGILIHYPRKVAAKTLVPHRSVSRGNVEDGLDGKEAERSGMRTPRSQTPGSRLGVVDDSLRKMRESSARRRTGRLKAELTPDEVRQLFRRQTGARLAALGKLLLLQRHAGPPDEEQRLQEEQERRQQIRVRMRRGYRKLCVVLRWFAIIVKISAERTSRTATEMQWYAVHDSNQESKKLSRFDPLVYSRTRVHAKLPLWAKQILDRQPECRTEAECRRIHAMLRGMPSFDRFTERIQLAMCRSITYVNVEPQRIILRMGHVGLNYYFIYSGSVFINVLDVNNNGQVFPKTSSVLSKGDSFGELALLRDIRRGATVTCRESCVLLAIDKDVFASVCPKIFEEELEEKMNFVSRLPLFNSRYWSNEAMRQLCSEAQIQDYKTNKVVVANSNEDEWVYISMQGECRMIKCLAPDDDVSDDVTESSEGDDEMLTAQFLESMKTQSGKSEEELSELLVKQGTSVEEADGEDVEVTEAIIQRHKATRQDMLESLDLEYNQSDNGSKTKSNTNRRRSFLLARKEDEMKKANLQGIITFNMLISMHKKKKMEYIYLDIGILPAKQMFNMSEVIKRTTKSKQNRNCIILVSSGCRLLRFKRSNFRALLTGEGLEHAKHLALKHVYPSDRVLLRSYRQWSDWQRYKEKTVEEVMAPHLHQARRRPLLEYERHVKSLRRRQESRVMSTLASGKIDEEENTEKYALEQKDIYATDDHEDVASRFMKAVPKIRIMPVIIEGIRQKNAINRPANHSTSSGPAVTQNAPLRSILKRTLLKPLHFNGDKEEPSHDESLEDSESDVNLGQNELGGDNHGNSNRRPILTW